MAHLTESRLASESDATLIFDTVVSHTKHGICDMSQIERVMARQTESYHK